MKYLLPTLIVLPVMEIYVLIEVGSYMGAINTIAAIFLTAFLGLLLIRKQGLQTLINARKKFLEAELPAEEIITGLFLALGGLLLVTPGFITDTFGFICLFPATRRLVIPLFNISFFDFKPQAKESRETKDWIEGDFSKDD